MQDHFQVSSMKKDIMPWLSLKALSSSGHDRKKGSVNGTMIYFQNVFNLLVQSKVRSQNKPRGKERSEVGKIPPLPSFLISYSDSFILISKTLHMSLSICFLTLDQPHFKPSTSLSSLPLTHKQGKGASEAMFIDFIPWFPVPLSLSSYSNSFACLETPTASAFTCVYLAIS